MITIAGDLTLDILIPFKGLKRKGQVIVKPRIHLGGSAAICSAALATHRKVYFYACIGKDEFGKILERKLKKFKVKGKRYKVDELTSITIAFIDGMKFFYTFRGSNERLSKEMIKLKGKWFHVGGIWHCKKLQKDLLQLLKIAKDKGMICSLDFGAMAMGEVELVYDWSEFLDFIFINEVEAKKLDIKKIKCDLIIHSSEWVKFRGKRFKVEKVKARNPVGAGDVFAAGFIDSWLEGNELDHAIKKAMGWAKNYVKFDDQEMGFSSLSMEARLR